jgi:hypothetical protein
VRRDKLNRSEWQFRDYECRWHDLVARSSDHGIEPLALPGRERVQPATTRRRRSGSRRAVATEHERPATPGGFEK